MQDVSGKTAFITGAASGIGRGMANAFGAAGMRIMLADIDRESLERTEAELEERGVEVSSVVVDVTKEDSVFAAADATVDVFASAPSCPGSSRTAKADTSSRRPRWPGS